MIDGRLDRHTSYTRVRSLFQYRRSDDGKDMIAHLAHVADMADRMVRSLSSPVRLSLLEEVEHDPAELAWHVGLWHHAIYDALLNYDDVLRYTNTQVADWVAVMTPDRRQPTPRQLRDYCEAVATRGRFLQLLAMADSFSHLEEVLCLAFAAKKRAWRHVRARAEGILAVSRSLYWIERGPFDPALRWLRKTAAEIVDCAYNRREDVLQEALTSRGEVITREQVVKRYENEYKSWLTKPSSTSS